MTFAVYGPRGICGTPTITRGADVTSSLWPTGPDYRAKVTDQKPSSRWSLIPMEECRSCGDWRLSWETAGRLSEMFAVMLESGICALRWDGPSILGHGDVAMPGVRRRALAAKFDTLTNP